MGRELFHALAYRKGPLGLTPYVPCPDGPRSVTMTSDGFREQPRGYVVDRRTVTCPDCLEWIQDREVEEAALAENRAAFLSVLVRANAHRRWFSA